MAGGPWSQQDRRDILDYCASDVDALGRLLPVMLPQIDLPRAIYRGRQMVAIAAMEFHGVPINRERLDLLRENWEPIQDRLIARINPAYQVFDGRTFKRGRFEGWLVRNNVSWPRLESGQLDLEDDTFREMSKIVPAVAPLRDCGMHFGDAPERFGRGFRRSQSRYAFALRRAQWTQHALEHEVHLRTECLAPELD